MALSIEYTAYTSGSMRDVWNLWKNVETWPNWDSALQASSLQKGHKFKRDGECVLTIHGNPQPIVARITDCVSRKQFTTQSKNDLGVVTIYHELGLSDQGVRITHKMVFNGNNEKTTQIFEKNVWPHLSRGLEQAVDSLAALSGSVNTQEKREGAPLERDIHANYKTKASRKN